MSSRAHRTDAAGCRGLAGCAVGPELSHAAHADAGSLRRRRDHGQRRRHERPGNAATAASRPHRSTWPHGGTRSGIRELDSLVDARHRRNPDLWIALDRLQAARTYEAAVIGTVLPVAEASAGSGPRYRHRSGARPRLADPGVRRQRPGLKHINEIGGFDAVWELDIFGKYRREIEAARYDTQAALAARNVVLLAVIADVARAYVDLRGLQVRASVLNQASRRAARIAAHREHPLRARHHQRAGRDAGDARAGDARGPAGARRRRRCAPPSTPSRRCSGSTRRSWSSELRASRAWCRPCPGPWPRACRSTCCAAARTCSEAERELAGGDRAHRRRDREPLPGDRGHRRGGLPAPGTGVTAGARSAHLVGRSGGGVAAARLRRARRPGGDRRPADARAAGELQADHPGRGARGGHQPRPVRRAAGEPRASSARRCSPASAP